LPQRHGACQSADEPAGVLLAPRKRLEKFNLQRAWRREQGEPRGEVVHWLGGAVPGSLVAGECPCKRQRAADADGDRVSEQFCVTERVGDALTCDRIHHQARVADERPAWPVRLAEEVGQIGSVAEALGAPAFADPLAQANIVESAQEVALDVAAERAVQGGWPSVVGHHQPISCRPGADRIAGSAVDLAAGHRDICPVGVVGKRERWPDAVLRGANQREPGTPSAAHCPGCLLTLNSHANPCSA